MTVKVRLAAVLDLAKASQMKGLLARLATIPLGAIGALVTAHFALTFLGPAEYGAATIIVGLPLVLPFVDLGLGSAVMNAAADSSKYNYLPGTYRKCFRLLFVVALVVCLLAGAMAFFDLWGIVVGPQVSDSFRLGASIALAGFAFSIPLGLGHRLLLGLGRADLSAYIWAIQPTSLGLMSAVALPLRPAADTLLVAIGASSVITAGIAHSVGRRIAGSQLRGKSRPVPHSLASLAMPSLVVSITVPLNFQSGRWLLAQSDDGLALATFALLLQIFVPLTSAAYSFGAGMFATYRSSRIRKSTQLRKNIKVSLLVAMLLAILNFLGGWLAFAVVGAGLMEFPLLSSLLLSLTVLAWTLSQPAIALLTTPKLFRRQALFGLITVVLNIGLTVMLSAQQVSVFAPSAALLLAIVCGSTVPVNMVAAKAAPDLEYR